MQPYLSSSLIELSLRPISSTSLSLRPTLLTTHSHRYLFCCSRTPCQYGSEESSYVYDVLPFQVGIDLLSSVHSGPLF